MPNAFNVEETDFITLVKTILADSSCADIHSGIGSKGTRVYNDIMPNTHSVYVKSYSVGRVRKHSRKSEKQKYKYNKILMIPSLYVESNKKKIQYL